jgi:hypothetical protein
MAKQLRTVLEDLIYCELQRVARSRQMSLAEWVREALDRALRHEPLGSVDEKLGAIRTGARYGSPTSDVGTMLAEIEPGYASGQ